MAHTKWIETNLWKAVTNGKMNQNDHDWDEGAICVQYKSASQNTASWTPFLLRSFTTESRGKSDRQCRCTILYRHMNRNDGRICGHAGDTRCTLRGCMNRNMEVISECRGVEVTGYCCTPCWCMNRNRQKLILPKNRGCILCGCINRNQAKEAAMFPLHTLHPTRMCESKWCHTSTIADYVGAWIEIPRIQPPVRCIPYGRMNRQCKCVNQKDEHDSPYDMNRNKLVESRNKRGNESKRNVGVYWTKYDLHK